MHKTTATNMTRFIIAMAPLIRSLQRLLASVFLSDPPQLARLVVGCLPSPRKYYIVVGRRAALENELRLSSRFVVDGAEAGGKFGDDDQVTTRFGLEVIIAHELCVPRF